jgi:hypothetical protein
MGKGCGNAVRYLWIFLLSMMSLIDYMNCPMFRSWGMMHGAMILA